MKLLGGTKLNGILFDTVEDEMCFASIRTSRAILKTLDEDKEYSDDIFNKILGKKEKEELERMGFIYQKGNNWVVLK